MENNNNKKKRAHDEISQTRTQYNLQVHFATKEVIDFFMIELSVKELNWINENMIQVDIASDDMSKVQKIQDLLNMPDYCLNLHLQIVTKKMNEDTLNWYKSYIVRDKILRTIPRVGVLIDPLLHRRFMDWIQEHDHYLKFNEDNAKEETDGFKVTKRM
jgi:hypothetical protein